MLRMYVSTKCRKNVIICCGTRGIFVKLRVKMSAYKANMCVRSVVGVLSFSLMNKCTFKEYSCCLTTNLHKDLSLRVSHLLQFAGRNGKLCGENTTISQCTVNQMRTCSTKATILCHIFAVKQERRKKGFFK